MLQRRILSLWFPRLGADHAARHDPLLREVAFAVATDRDGRQILASLSAPAQRAGLSVGMALADARAACPDLLTRPADPQRLAEFRSALCRWAGRFSPWVAEDGADALLADLTGCAHLFGGETALAAQLRADCADFGLDARIGIAGTPGAAWAVARFAAGHAVSRRNGDAIDQEARATRSRAVRRSRDRSAPTPDATVCIVPSDGIRAALAPLPIMALRLEPDVVANLVRLGLRQVGDLAALPRAALARRFGTDVVRRLDQAFGAEPEPISPARAAHHFATRLGLPDPIGLESDILAGLDRLLPPLCDRLRAAGHGARRIAFTLTRVDRSTQTLAVGLARPTWDPAAIRPLIALQTDRIEAGFGIDRLRLHATVTEPVAPEQHRGHADATTGGAPLDALLNRIGARLGMEALTRLYPAESHIPEKSGIVMAAAFSAPAPAWPARAGPRPLRLFVPERLTPADAATPPVRFRWRRRDHSVARAAGPERLAPEWWLDDPAWRSGARDYWRVETAEGSRLWLFEARGEAGGWFVHGDFC